MPGASGQGPSSSVAQIPWVERSLASGSSPAFGTPHRRCVFSRASGALDTLWLDAVLAAGRVLAEEHGRRRREISAVVPVQVHGAGAVAAVPPDLVAAAVGAGQEVARAEVLDGDAVHLEHLDAVAARRLTVPVERA